MGLFELGQIRVTELAQAALTAAGMTAAALLARHAAGDWGEVGPLVKARNDFSTRHAERIRSRYAIAGLVDDAVMVGTAEDRSETVVFLESEFQRVEVSLREGYAHWSKTYDENANALVALDERYGERLLTIIETPIARALDVGTGTGRRALALAEQGIAVDALDQSPEMLARARAKVQARGLNVTFYEQSLEAGLRFDDETFDLVVCSLVLSHVEGLMGTLAAFYRVLKPGGHVQLSMFHPDAIHIIGWRTSHAGADRGYVLPNALHTRDGYWQTLRAVGFVVRAVVDGALRDVPAGRMTPLMQDTLWYVNVGLFVLAQKPLATGDAG